MIALPDPLPGTHLAQVDCNECGAVVLAVPHHADDAKCSHCWVAVIEAAMAARPMSES